jgi:hypothetical protein
LTRPLFIQEGVIEAPALTLSTGGGTSIAYFAEEGRLAGSEAIERHQQMFEASVSADASTVAALVQSGGDRKKLERGVLQQVFPEISRDSVNDLAPLFGFLQQVSERVQEPRYEERLEHRVKEKLGQARPSLEEALLSMYDLALGQRPGSAETGQALVLEQIIGREDLPQVGTWVEQIDRANEDRGPVHLRLVTSEKDLAQELKSRFGGRSHVFVRYVDALSEKKLSEDYLSWVRSPESGLAGQTVRLTVGVSAHLSITTGEGPVSEYVQVLRWALGKIQPIDLQRMFLIAEIVSRNA